MNVSIEIAGVILSILGILLVAGYKPFIEKSSRIYFTAFFVCLALDFTDLGTTHGKINTTRGKTVENDADF